MEEILMAQPESKVEVSLHEPRVKGFLRDLMELCIKYRAAITVDDEVIVEFSNWDYCTRLEVDSEGASLYWPRIQTEIVVRRKNEQRKSKEAC